MATKWLHSLIWTLIAKSWKIHPEIFLKFSFSCSSHRPFYRKTHPLKIMSTYSVFSFNSGASNRPFYRKTHPFEFFWLKSYICYVTFGLDEFSSKTVSESSQKVANKGQSRGDSMILKISWVADPSRSENVMSRSEMVHSCHINCQNFGEFIFGKIIAKKLVFTSNFSSV